MNRMALAMAIGLHRRCSLCQTLNPWQTGTPFRIVIASLEQPQQGVCLGGSDLDIVEVRQVVARCFANELPGFQPPTEKIRALRLHGHLQDERPTPPCGNRPLEIRCACPEPWLLCSAPTTLAKCWIKACNCFGDILTAVATRANRASLPCTKHGVQAAGLSVETRCVSQTPAGLPQAQCFLMVTDAWPMRCCKQRSWCSGYLDMNAQCHGFTPHRCSCIK